MVRGKAGGDPAAVVYDAIEKAKEQQADILLVDTAWTSAKQSQFDERIREDQTCVIQRELPKHHMRSYLCWMRRQGKNAMVQAKQFKETSDVTGLV